MVFSNLILTVDMDLRNGVEDWGVSRSSEPRNDNLAFDLNTVPNDFCRKKNNLIYLTKIEDLISYILFFVLLALKSLSFQTRLKKDYLVKSISNSSFIVYEYSETRITVYIMYLSL